MKNLILILLAVTCQAALAQDRDIQTTPYTRDVLKSADAATARGKLGVGTNGALAGNVTLTGDVTGTGPASNVVTKVVRVTDAAIPKNIARLYTGGSLTNENSYGTGQVPNGLSVADFNGDGFTDFAVADKFGGASAVTFYQNNGAGAFSLYSTNIPTDNPEPVATAFVDLFKNGNLALIVATYDNSIVDVMTNNGSRFYISTNFYTGGGNPVDILAADVNGDGWQDVIEIGYNGGGCAVFTNNRAGNFVFCSSNPMAFPVAVASGDLNRDGSTDLVVANFGGNTLTVLTNLGNGFFNTNQVLTEITANGVTISDFNADGFLDIAAVNVSSNTATIFTNTGACQFIASQTFSVGSNPTKIVAADFSGRGYQDIAVCGYGAAAVYFYTNNGTGFFTLSQSNVVGTHPFSLAAADINNDNFSDLLVTVTDSNKVTVIKNSTAGAIPLSAINGSISGGYVTTNQLATQGQNTTNFALAIGLSGSNNVAAAVAPLASTNDLKAATNQLWNTNNSQIHVGTPPSNPQIVTFHTGVGGTFVASFDDGSTRVALGGYSTNADIEGLNLAGTAGAPLAINSAGMPILMGGNVVLNNGIVGNGSGLTNLMLSATASLTFTSVSAGAFQTQTITVTGANVNDDVLLGLPASPHTAMLWTAWVSSANTVTVRCYNTSGSTVTTSPETYRATVNPH